MKFLHISKPRNRSNNHFFSRPRLAGAEIETLRKIHKTTLLKLCFAVVYSVAKRLFARTVCAIRILFPALKREQQASLILEPQNLTISECYVT